MKTRLVALVALSVPAVLFCQEFRGTISGSVTDPTGAAVPGARVVVTETHTGTKIPTVSDSTGRYTAPFLLPGDYDIAVEMQGFKAFLRKGVHVGADDHVVIDVKLDVGDVSTAVEVAADAPLLNTDNATVGQTVTTRDITDLPINGRTPMMAANLSLGVISYAQPTLVHPFDSGGAAGWAIGGAYQQTSELLLDGSPDATWDGRLAYSPPQDAVQEVRVKISDTDAAFGHTAGGTLNQITKSGTNSLHGSAWEFNQPNTLTANDFFLNKAGTPRPVTHFNQYGVTAGGPFYVPKVIDTRNKLFWFFAWEGIKDGQPNPNYQTVPTDAMRQGNFTGLPTIYDPYSAVQSGSTITRQPLTGNQVPQNSTYLNPIAKAYLAYYPEPNVPGALINNYANAPNTTDNYSNELGRLDYNMSDRSRVFFDIRHTDYSQVKNDYFNNIAEGSLLYRSNLGVVADEVYTFNPTNIVDVRLNFSRMNEGHDIPSVGFDPTTLGFPSYMSANSRYLQLPVISFNSNTGLTPLGATGANKLPSQSYQLFGTWVKIQGNHTLKFGADVRQYRLNTFTAGASTGTFSFGNNWDKASSSASSTVTTGQDFAAFLMGLPTSSTSAGYDVNTYASWYSYYAAGFVQDDWRVRSDLTVNLGARYEHDGPYNEKYGRTVNGFDTTDANPLAAAAQAAYAKNPIAQLPAGAFNPLGGLTFPASGQSAVYQNTSHLVSPRAGFAWTPGLLHGKTVIRGGFGMFVAPVTIAAMGIDGKFSTNPDTNQEGFSQSTPAITTTTNYLTPSATLSNPFPNGLLPASGSSLGLLTFAGQAVTFLNPDVKSPYSLRWNFGFQHTLSNDIVVEVMYIGNHSVHLPIDYTQLNGIPRSLLSTLGTRDTSQNYLTSSVPNPFAGLQTSSNGSTTTPAQLLAHFPEFPTGDSASGWSGSGGVLEQNLNIGSSYFNSLNVRVQKRLSHGISFVTNYIYSRLIERMTWLNDSDPAPEKRISTIDHPHRVVVAMSYDVPFGRGRAHSIQSRFLDAVIGGWTLNNVYTWQIGAPIAWENGSSSSPGDYVYFGAPIILNNREVGPGQKAFNTTAFDTNAADALQYHLRTFPTTFSSLRMDGILQWDPSLLKRISITEKSSLELRFEAYNALNRPTFAAPSTTASNSAFGTITATANRFRTIQLGARLVF
ncbi:MAG TPA: TonB-dependent receptor [Bryobacteraceae bacterium]|nr:TonB-dependent receptor [Bryobacteraceae bacterium]